MGIFTPWRKTGNVAVQEAKLKLVQRICFLGYSIRRFYPSFLIKRQIQKLVNVLVISDLGSNIHRSTFIVIYR